MRQWLYTLRLQHGAWYVGRSSNLSRRLKQHTSGRGSAWTRRHPPVDDEFWATRELPKGVVGGIAEDALTKQLMLEHGVDNVRGGSHSQVHLPSKVRTVINIELRHARDECFVCGSPGHKASRCPDADEQRRGRKRPRSLKEPRGRNKLQAVETFEVDGGEDGVHEESDSERRDK